MILMNDVLMKFSQIFIINALSNLQNHNNVLIILNFFNFYKCLIQKYSRIFIDLTTLFSSQKYFFLQIFRMTDEAIWFFCKLKKNFVPKSLLRIFSSKLFIKIESNFLKFIILYILSQFHDEKWQSITFWFKKKNSWKEKLEYKQNNQSM